MGHKVSSSYSGPRPARGEDFGISCGHFLPKAATHVWLQPESFHSYDTFSLPYGYPGRDWLLLIELQRLGGVWNDYMYITLGTEQFCRNWTILHARISWIHPSIMPGSHCRTEPGLWCQGVGFQSWHSDPGQAPRSPRSCCHSLHLPYRLGVRLKLENIGSMVNILAVK